MIYWLYMSVQFLHILVLSAWWLDSFQRAPHLILSPRLFVLELPALFEVQILVSHRILVQSPAMVVVSIKHFPVEALVLDQSSMCVVQCRVSQLEHLNSDSYPAW